MKSSTMRQLWEALRAVPQAVLWALGVMMALGVGVDFWSRVWVGSDERLRAFAIPKVVALSPPVSEANIQQSMQNWFPKPAVVEEVKPKELVLQGVLRAKGRSSAVIAVRVPGQPPSVRSLLREGEIIEGWTVERIDSRAVLIKNGDQTQTLTMLRTKPE